MDMFMSLKKSLHGFIGVQRMRKVGVAGKGEGEGEGTIRGGEARVTKGPIAPP
jgi:hypothetical protein